MPLTRLVYSSHAKPGFSRADLAAIGAVANAANPGMGITGGMLFCEGRFLQVLEGSATQVNNLYHRIVADARHHHVFLNEVSRIERRDFAAWSMKWMQAADALAIREILLRYHPREGFNPEQLTGESAAQMLKELSVVL